ncbi:MAG: hypothetical protein H6718_04180 [Polyangiaceae bacterium]|nr:hypothetical protein [Polyangiaceae bacterium]
MAQAIAAVWFYATHDDARVVLMAPSRGQTQGVVYREVRRLIEGARVAIFGDAHSNVMIGVRYSDGRSIAGTNATYGYSGDILFLGDEACGINDSIWQVVGSTERVLMTSTPNRENGYFYRSHHEDSSSWTRFHLSAFDVVESGIPGLATHEWLNHMRATYGETSLTYRNRCLGQFRRNAEPDPVVEPIVVAPPGPTRHERLRGEYLL